MRKILLAMSILATGTLSAWAAPPSAEQKDEFYSVCMGISQNQELCACKADAAMTLIDAEFMNVVINAMKGGSTQAGQGDAYNAYVAKSNQICKPNY